jgi:hypothetical protein
MKVYSYNAMTKEFLGALELGEGDRNPFKKDEFLLPANTVKQWPTVKAAENQTVIFNGSGWSLAPDFRSVSGWLQTGEELEINALGETLPADFIDYDPVLLAEEKTAEYEQAEAEAETIDE